jgi:hypothetical protein
MSQPAREQLRIGSGEDRPPQRLLEEAARFDDRRRVRERQQRPPVEPQSLMRPASGDETPELEPVGIDRNVQAVRLSPHG